MFTTLLEEVDELFEGNYADKVKESARKMSTGQFITVCNNNPKTLNNEPAPESHNTENGLFGDIFIFLNSLMLMHTEARITKFSSKIFHFLMTLTFWNGLNHIFIL